MPVSSPRPCRQAGCDQLVTMGYCPAHTPSYDRKGAKLYRSARWAGLRRAKLRQDPWCQTPGCPNLATDVDHIVPLRQDGPELEWSNLQSLCHRCHSQKTAKEVWGRK